MNKTIKNKTEAEKEYERIPSPPNQLAVAEYVRNVINKEWNKDKINTYEKKEFSNFMSKWNAEEVKQTSKTALQEMKEVLEKLENKITSKKSFENEDIDTLKIIYKEKEEIQEALGEK